MVISGSHYERERETERETERERERQREMMMFFLHFIAERMFVCMQKTSYISYIE